ncbi:hypothetical protein PENANT_c025G01062 [Penicillium antarcticum]|uniref:Mid2 domain-containing protein n=1 Tax=Penicillium antarcticum TaxID=416450 RepID=A0A1V6PXU8_9EURO|nr:hypothetical protein PENANT_c025G01062 [Penicillium antarcticum]
MWHCGGNDLYSVYTTGLPGKDGVAVDANSASNSTSSSTSTSESTSTSTSSAETASSADNNTPASDYIADDTQNSNNNINSNTGLIVGVVIGACGGAAVVIGALFFWRWRTRKQDAQKTGVDSAGDYCGDFGHEVSRADSRFDGDHLAECRKTNGSIDDLGDYSRRILKVTNPDR